jgi:hypothetical protein
MVNEAVETISTNDVESIFITNFDKRFLFLVFQSTFIILITLIFFLQENLVRQLPHYLNGSYATDTYCVFNVHYAYHISKVFLHVGKTKQIYSE